MTEPVGPDRYRDAADLWRAIASQAKTAAKADPALTSKGLIEEFLYGRLLARVFSGNDQSWVLKGGTAILARVRTARHSQDIDLFHRLGNLDAAIASLRELAAIDLGDRFRFVVPDGRARDTTQTQPGVAGARIKVTAYCGTKQAGVIPIDLVVGAVITEEPEDLEPQSRLDIPGFDAPRYRVYPVADHIADKLCATVERHGREQRESSRHRDMVDLVIIARTQTVYAAALWNAIEAERQHRGLDAITAYAAPESWRALYPGEARTSAECAEYPTFEAAHALISQFLDPVLDGRIRDQVWDPQGGWHQ
jgi:hypothetical protein